MHGAAVPVLIISSGLAWHTVYCSMACQPHVSSGPLLESYIQAYSHLQRRCRRCCRRRCCRRRCCCCCCLCLRVPAAAGCLQPHPAVGPAQHAKRTAIPCLASTEPADDPVCCLCLCLQVPAAAGCVAPHLAAGPARHAEAGAHFRSCHVDTQA
jgi:hypothetical protein